MGDAFQPSGISFDGLLFIHPHCVYFYTGNGCFCDAQTVEFTPGGQLDLYKEETVLMPRFLYYTSAMPRYSERQLESLQIHPGE
jgi:hypothetical protein